MRKLVFGLSLVAIALIAVPAMAQEGTFTSDGDVRMRWDYFGNYTDANDDTQDSYDVWPYRARLGATGRFTDAVWGRVELQAAGWWGDGTSSYNYPMPGASPSFEGTVNLYQAFVTLDGSTWDWQVGRAEKALGHELVVGDNDFYNGFVFDGIDVMADFSSVDLRLFWNQIDETFTSREDTWFGGAYLDVEIGKTHLEPYLLFLKSHDKGAGSFFGEPGEVYTLGLMWQRPMNEERRGWDLSLEAAVQGGEIGVSGSEADNKGYIFEGWFGWGFGGAGRVHLGYLLASGDDGTDADNDAWIDLFADPHAYNRLGNLDLFAGGFSNFGANNIVAGNGGMTNVSDINVGYNWWGGEKHHILAALHKLDFVEEVQAGTTDTDTGLEFDSEYGYSYADNAKFVVGFAYLNGGDALDQLAGGSADSITRGYAQLHINWGE